MIIEKKIKATLSQAGKTLSVAESCSGGLLAHRLTNTPGSSKYFHGGVIVYANSAKSKLLGVAPSLIKKHGAVSAPVAEEMASAVRKLLKTDFGVSITGIAGPSGGTQEKPVGLTYIAVSSATKTVCREFHFKGSRLSIKTSATQAALELLSQLLKGSARV